MNLGSRVVSWRSWKQSVPGDSTTEVEYFVEYKENNGIVWIRKFLEDIHVHSTPLLIYNTSAIKLAKNPRFNDQTK